MTPAIAPPKLLTVEEYAQLPDDGRKTELVRGRVVDVPPTYPFHGFVCGKVFKFVDRFVEAGNLGRVMTNDSGVVTERDPDTLRGGDVAFYSYARVPRGPLPAGYLAVVPELVFEVRSPGDRWGAILAKVGEYLEAGVTLVCVLDDGTRSAHVYRSDQPAQVFAAEQELVLPEVLPGFRAVVERFFE